MTYVLWDKEGFPKGDLSLDQAFQAAMAAWGVEFEIETKDERELLVAELFIRKAPDQERLQTPFLSKGKNLYEVQKNVKKQVVSTLPKMLKLGIRIEDEAEIGFLPELEMPAAPAPENPEPTPQAA